MTYFKKEKGGQVVFINTPPSTGWPGIEPDSYPYFRAFQHNHSLRSFSPENKGILNFDPHLEKISNMRTHLKC